MNELSTVIQTITSFVRSHDRALGTQIGVLLRERFPDFSARGQGFSSLTDMLDRAAPELSIIGRSGQDYVWSTHADLNMLDTDLERQDAVEEGVVETNHVRLLGRFEARNFKSLAHIELPLRPFNVLVGANGAGKTSILEGLFMLSQLRYKKPATIFAAPRELSKYATQGQTGSTQLRLELDGEPVEFIEYLGRTPPDEPSLHSVEIGRGVQVQRHEYGGSQVAETSPRQLPLLRAFGGSTLLRLDARKLAKATASVREQPTLRHDGLGLAAVLADLAATDHARLVQIFEATRAIIPAFARARMPRQLLKTSKGEEVGNGLELELHGRWHQAELASEGTLLVLGLMTIVHGLRSTRLLLMDDIERALHPKAQRMLVTHLAAMTGVEHGLQLVCTTHSPYMLDAVDPEDVWVVRAAPETGHTRCRRLVEHATWEKWREMMSPGEFWSHVGEDWLEGE